MAGNSTDSELEARVSGAAVRAQLDRILDTESFRAAPRLTRLLSYLVEQTLAGNERDIKEYSLGVDVFDRGADFDPQTDSIVRVQAGRLRKRLEAYYEGAGKADPTILSMPTGHYRLRFRNRAIAHLGEGDATVPNDRVDRAGGPIQRSRLPKPLRWLIPGVAAMLAFIIIWLMRTEAPPSMAAARGISVAVLPFDDMSPRHDQQYLSDGISEEILHQLTRIPELRVIARTSSFAWRDRPANISSIARQLSVTHILEGSVKRDGERLRVTAQLIEAASDSHVWSQAYDSDADNIFELQEQIASSVANALELTLKPRSNRHKVDPQAYRLYLQARHLLIYSYDVEGCRKLLDRVIDIDPDFALGWLLMARIELNALAEGRKTEGDAAWLIHRTLKADPEFALAHSMLGDYARSVEGDLVAAARHYETAVRLAPNDPFVHELPILLDFNMVDAALAHARYEVAANPAFPAAHLFLARAQMLSGDLAGAEASVRTIMALRRPIPVDDQAYALLGKVQLGNGQWSAALESFSVIRDERARLWGSAIALHHLGQVERAVTMLQSLTEVKPAAPAALIAQGYAWVGDTERAFYWLDRVQQVFTYWGGDFHPSEWPAVTTDPRWSDFLERIGAAPSTLAASRPVIAPPPEMSFPGINQPRLPDLDALR